MLKTTLLTILSCFIFSSCKLIVPDVSEAPPREIPRTSLVFSKIAALTENEIITEPMTCSKLKSILSSTGHCSTQASPGGAILDCPLPKPLESFRISCGRDSKRPELYYAFEWAKDAEIPDLLPLLGNCSLRSEGPIVQRPARYLGDKGYSVCIFEGTATALVSDLRSDDGSQVLVPSGLYLDFYPSLKAEKKLDELWQDLKSKKLRPPLTIVGDTQRLNEEESQILFTLIPVLFDALLDLKKDEQ